MGAPDQLAKEVFAEEVPRLFGDKVVWQIGTELSLTEVRLDGVLGVLKPLELPALPAPWSLLGDRVTVVEVKMPGDHLDAIALERALLRRQALQVTVMETDSLYDKQVALWVIAPHVPKLVRDRYHPEAVAPGCWRLGLGEFEMLWIAANELPLDEALWPFLVARSGQPLVEMLRWAMRRQPLAWVSRVLETVSLTEETKTMLKQDLREYAHPDNPEAHRRLAEILEVMVETMAPEVGTKLAAEAIEAERRASIESVCEVLGIELNASRRSHLAGLDLDALRDLLATIKSTRAWPSG